MTKSNSVIDEIQKRYPNLSYREAELLVIELLNQVAKNIIDGKDLAFINLLDDKSYEITTYGFELLDNQLPKINELESEGRLVIKSSRLSTAKETAEFLSDLDKAYKGAFSLALYETGENFFYNDFPDKFELQISKVNFNSPGFWEFLGSLNPLQQIREYLNDRHERKKDNEYRNPLDKEKLSLENDKLKNELDLQTIEKDTKLLENMALQNKIIKERLEMIKNLGLPKEKMLALIDKQFVEPMLKLNKYQDNGLISEVNIVENKKGRLR